MADKTEVLAAINNGSICTINALRPEQHTGTGGVHVSCDADWVDPAEAPGVGTPVRGGATLREAHLAMEIVHDSGATVAMDLVEINPILDRQNHTAELCAELIASAFGRRIL